MVHIYIYIYINYSIYITYLMMSRDLESVRVCFWSNTGGAHLVETNVECFSSTTSATETTSAITNTSMYVWIYLYLNNIK